MASAAPAYSPLRTPAPVRLSEVLAALSRALDLTEGQPVGHSIRACAIGMRFADALALSADERSALYYTLLLKDAGCSSNAARFAALFGSPDQWAKYRMKLTDWHRPLRLALRTALTVGHRQSLTQRLRHFTSIASTPHVTRDLIRVRCDRGADIALQLGFPALTADAIRSLDEHWDGGGHPEGLSGERIPLLSRIANLAQTTEIFLSRSGSAAALRVARSRRGRWFDPHLVDLLLAWRDSEWWRMLHSAELPAFVSQLEPEAARRYGGEAELDTVARAFAAIIDAKSPFTWSHSSNVAELARSAVHVMGLGHVVERQVHRAGLLHDIGKLGVSSTILEKRGRLEPDEVLAIMAHPRYTWEILSPIAAFSDVARLAAVHHEKLDGSGYPWGLRADELDNAERILAVADVYEALTADRPYRAALSHDDALRLIRGECGGRLCAASAEALQEALSSNVALPRPA